MELKWSFLLLGPLLVLFTTSFSLADGVKSCDHGFRGDRDRCEDENECDHNPCGNHSVCRNTDGSYYCSCLKGFQSRTHNFTATTGQCKDVNECVINKPCSQNTTCRNTIGSYICECLPGYQEVQGSKDRCIDIDECDSEEHVCGEHGSCSNLPGSYSCTCEAGFNNYGNNKTKCTELKCEHGTTGTKQPGMSHLLDLFMMSCQSLSHPKEQHGSGEALLKRLLNVSDEVVSSGDFRDSSTLTTFLGAMEKTLRLVGPQLSQPITKMDNDNSEAWLAVKKDVTPPNGSVILDTDDVHLNISWKTACGEEYPGFAYVALVSYKGLNSTSTSILKDPDPQGRNASYQLNSRVVTALVSNTQTQNLPEPVTLTFKHLQEGAVSEHLNYSCMYWDESQGKGIWSGQGCVKAEFNATHAVCSWSHLSSFAVLMALYPIKDSFELTLITQIGLSLSLVCLVVCILTFWLCRSIKGTRTTIHLHLCLSLFIADFLFLFFITSTKNKVGCAIVAGLLHFFFLSAFCWMLLDGVQLYRMVVKVFHTTLRPLYMVAVGYGVPLAIVIISSIAYPKGYGTDRHCWLSLEEDFIWSFFAPVCIIIILNSFFFVITVWKLAGKFSSLNPDLSKLKKLRMFVVTAVAQLCVLGGMWVFGCFLFQEQGTVVMLYLFTLLNSLQGALIFIMHCLMSKTIRQEYSKLCGGVCTPQKKRYSEFSTNQSSNSQRPLKSAPSTGESQI
ncbi:adhesion G protein-coupled receptor E5-like isoform X2 [Salminus brasiliensis]|uniref:adhesion G protein-coupled receptor E5-like isoform X2 n=1 Tax=Salminus brasiliensis TaxID=930266 RepID=UPI003B8308CF